MSRFEEIALRNLEILSHPKHFAANKFSLSGNEMISNEDDTFDTIYTLDDLEFPVYFTFHQLINHVHSSYHSKYNGYTRLELMEMMNDALENLYENYETSGAKHLRFGEMLDDLDEKVYFIQQYYRYGACLWLPGFVKSYLNTWCRLMLQSGTICNDMVKMIYPNPYDSDDSDEDEEDDEDGEDEEDEEDGEEGVDEDKDLKQD